MKLHDGEGQLNEWTKIERDYFYGRYDYYHSNNNSISNNMLRDNWLPKKYFFMPGRGPGA